jgi:hypothetical protein
MLDSDGPQSEAPSRLRRVTLVWFPFPRSSATFFNCPASSATPLRLCMCCKSLNPDPPSRLFVSANFRDAPPHHEHHDFAGTVLAVE